MKTLIIILACVVIFAFVVYTLTKVSDIEREHQKMQDDYKRACERHKQHEEELSRRENHPINPALSLSEVSKAAAEAAKHAQENAERKKAEAAATEAAKKADTQMTFGFEPQPVEKPAPDPNKPKRKSPVEHTVIHHDDNFWLGICREYQVLKHKNPKLTQTDFVKTKGDPTIKVKTFNEKMRQLAQTGMFIHKPRTNKK